jgi:hypothetical protein
MLFSLRKDKKPEIASEKIKPLMLEVCRRIGEDWISGGCLDSAMYSDTYSAAVRAPNKARTRAR